MKPDDGGKLRCQNVTAVGGGPCEVPNREDRRKRKKKVKKEGGGGDEKSGDEGGKSEDEGGAATTDDEAGGDNKNSNKNKKKKKPRNKKKNGAKGGEEKKEDEDGKKGAAGGGAGKKGKKRFDEGFTEEVIEAMKEKKLDMRQATILVAIDNARLKFGPDGYAALCHADGIMAEGTFTCDESANVAITWRNVLKYEDDAWKPSDPLSNTSNGSLVSAFNWKDEKVQGLKALETPESLWGEGKADPTDALQSNNFQMRKCFLVKGPANKRGRGRRNPRGKKNDGAKKDAGEKKDGEEKTGGESGNVEEQTS